MFGYVAAGALTCRGYVAAGALTCRAEAQLRIRGEGSGERGLACPDEGVRAYVIRGTCRSLATLGMTTSIRNCSVRYRVAAGALTCRAERSSACRGENSAERGS